MLDKSVFDVSVFIVMKEGQIVNLDECVDNCDDGEFIMLTNNVLNSDYDEDNTIYIHRDWKQQTNDIYDSTQTSYTNYKGGVLWSYTPSGIINCPKMNDDDYDLGEHQSDKRMLNLLHLVNGQQQSDDIMMNGLKMLNKRPWKNLYNTFEHFIPSLDGAYKTIITYQGKRKHGYLPQIGQLLFISKNINRVNDGLEKIGVEMMTVEPDKGEYGDRLEGMWWSCLEYDNSRAWGIQGGVVQYMQKNQSNAFVLPLFTI